VRPLRAGSVHQPAGLRGLCADDGNASVALVSSGAVDRRINERFMVLAGSPLCLLDRYP
jgi:hypothetical protein